MAKVGDKVEIITSPGPGVVHFFQKGTKGTVSTVYGDDDFGVQGFNKKGGPLFQLVRGSDVKIINETEKQTNMENFSVGQKVKVVNNQWYGHRLGIGTDAVVTAVGTDGNLSLTGVMKDGTPVYQTLHPSDVQSINTDMKQKQTFKVGDTVQIAANTTQHGFQVGETVRLVTNQLPKQYDYQAEALDGSDFWFLDEADIKTVAVKSQPKTAPAKAKLISNAADMKAATKEVADEFYQANQRITTLELKNELRKKYPYVLWNQYTTMGIPGVSDMFHELVREGHFTSIADNGTYQTYKSNSVKPKKTKATVTTGTTTTQPVKNPQASTRVKVSAPATGTKISRSKALELIQNNKGHFFTATFTKKDGQPRTINAQYVKDQTPSPLGYVLVKEAKLMKQNAKDQIRNLNLQTLQTLKIAGGFYTIK